MAKKKSEKRVLDNLFSISSVFGLAIVMILGALVISTSIWYSEENETALETGAWPTKDNVERLIIEAARQGDYELAQELYGNRKVLGFGRDEYLERAVYPDRYEKDMLNRYEEFVAKYPDYRDGLVQLSQIYEKLGNKTRADELRRRSLWLDPFVE